MSAYGYSYEMEYVMSYIAMLDQPQVIGPVAEGLRININVTGGTVDGPKIKGKFIPVGADWLTVRTDGISVLDVRATIQTDRRRCSDLSLLQGPCRLGTGRLQEFHGRRPTSSRRNRHTYQSLVPDSSSQLPMADEGLFRRDWQGVPG